MEKTEEPMELQERAHDYRDGFNFERIRNSEHPFAEWYAQAVFIQEAQEDEEEEEIEEEEKRSPLH